MGVGTTLARRAVFLAAALVIAVFLTGVILGASGYIDKVLNAIVLEEVRAYRQSLSRLYNLTAAERDRLVAEYEKTLRDYYQLDKPWIYRLVPTVLSTLTLDLGYVQSGGVAEVAGYQLPVKVSTVVLTCLPRTIFMITVAEAIVIVIALLVAPFIVYRIGSLVDRAVVAYAAVMNAFPLWWIALVMLFTLGYRWGIAPTRLRAVTASINALFSGNLLALGEVFYYAWLPILTIVIVLLGPWIYSVRAMLIRVVKEDYVTAAVARGLPEKYVLRRYIMRPAASPIVTNVILGLAGTIGGYIITESVFEWPGMGTLYYSAIVNADAPTILALTYIFTLVYVVARFILEVLYIVLDPRVRL